MLANIDGRSSSARRFRDICRAYEVELGGNISEVERDMVKQAAGLTLRAEQLQSAVVRGENVNNDELIRLSGTAKRLLDSIRARGATKRKAAAPSLQDHLARRASERVGIA